MRNLTTIIEDLKRDEGFRSHAYRDSESYLTIGYGRMIDERLGGGISETEARYLLANDVHIVTFEMDRNIPWWRNLPDEVSRGLVNMAFQLGLPRLLGFKKMLTALEAGDYHKAADEALDSKWAKQVGARAERIAALYRSG